MIRLFHLSDLHFGAADAAALAAARAAIVAEQPHLVLITGDLTMRARASEYAAARDWITGLGRPVAVEPGNHDLPYFNLWERFTNPYRRYRQLVAATGRADRITVADDRLAIVPLWTTARAQWRLDWSKGIAAPAALARTLATLDNLPDGTTALVACHHPLVETGTHGKALTHGGNHALAELARRKVAAVLSGHVHDGFDRMIDTAAGPIRMIGAGTLSQRLRRTPPAYNVLEISDGTLRLVPRTTTA